jgi:glycosyltransferase involved in cell wall biosynthesis
MPTICLSMIVKNESQVLATCLRSIRPFLNSWVIHDTGSTDGTQALIRKELKGLPGVLRERKWVDFATNRNLALADACTRADYLLFIDADEVWEYPEKFKLPPLTADVYYMTVRQVGAAEFQRMSLVRSSLRWSWQGKLHEHLTAPDVKTQELLTGIRNICNSHQGARALDPLTRVRDAELLVQALREEPTNSRYAYYAGISYLAAGKIESALRYFTQRFEMDTEPNEERYLACYHMGVCHLRLERKVEAEVWFREAYELRPHRAEPLKELAVLSRQRGHLHSAILLLRRALTLPYPRTDNCVWYLTYDHQLLIELMNCLLLTGQWAEGREITQRLLTHPGLPVTYLESLRKNLALADKQLADKQLADKQLADKQLADKQLADKQLADKQLADKQLADK